MKSVFSIFAVMVMLGSYAYSEEAETAHTTETTDTATHEGTHEKMNKPMKGKHARAATAKKAHHAKKHH